MSDKNIVASLREIVQDLLVPEVKEIKAELTAIRTEMKQTNEALREDLRQTNEALREDLRQTNDALREEIRLRHENLELLIKHGDARNEQLILALSSKLDYSMEIRERLASIEARMPRQ